MELTVLEALEVVGDGHSVVEVDLAQAVCQKFAVAAFPEEGVLSWQSQQQAWETYGFFADEDQPGRGVWTLELSYHVAKELGLGASGRKFHGRGRQARENMQAIARSVEMVGQG
jgi:hypothetical protein